MKKAPNRKLEKDLHTLRTQLAKITARIEAITEAITKPESPAKKQKKRKAASAKMKTASKAKKKASTQDLVLDAIKAAADGIGAADLANSLGISIKNAQNAVFRLKKQGRVTTVKRGIYKA